MSTRAAESSMGPVSEPPGDPLEQPRPPFFSWSQQGQFTLKELRETLRDRRTLVTLLAMPVLLYPLLGLGLRFLAWQQFSAAQPNYLLAVSSDCEAQWLAQELARGQRLLASETRPSLEDAQPPALPAEEPQVRLIVPENRSPADLEQLVVEGALDVAIQVQLDQPADGDSFPVATVKLLENRQLVPSRQAADYVERCLAASNLEQMRRWALARQQDFRIPIEQQRSSVAAATGNSALLGLLPLILLLMTVTGGVYPAIDLTAGERERNTLETLISLPVPRFRLLLAKYVAVMTVTMLTGIMNLLAMSVTLYALQLDKLLLGGGGLTLLLAAKLLLALAAFALFYSAVLLMLTSSARSFKEAQAYLIPLLLLSIGPGMVILLPGWQLDHTTAAMPLINVLLLSREMLEGTANLLPAVVAIVSTIFYGLAALALAAGAFGADATSVGSRGRWTDLLRRGQHPQAMQTLTLALVGLATVFPAYFIASGILSRGADMSASHRLMLSGAMTLAIFLGVPLGLLAWQRVPLRRGLSLGWPRPVLLLAALLLGLSAWPWVFELVVGLRHLGWPGLDPARLKVVEDLLAGWNSIPLATLLLALGLVPGLAEECFFRGFLYNGIRQHASALATILATALIFGLFHLVLAGGAAPERLVPSTLLGLLLGWVRWSSGSVMPGILLHALHNSMLLALAHFRERLPDWGLRPVMEGSHLPPSWLGIAGVLFILGAALTYWYSRGRRNVPTASN